MRLAKLGKQAKTLIRSPVWHGRPPRCAGKHILCDLADSLEPNMPFADCTKENNHGELSTSHIAISYSFAPKWEKRFSDSASRSSRG
jgi:hypothetical protein